MCEPQKTNIILEVSLNNGGSPEEPVNQSMAFQQAQTLHVYAGLSPSFFYLDKDL